MNNSAELEKIKVLVKELRPDMSEEEVAEHSMKLLEVTKRTGGKRKTHRRRKVQRKTRHRK